MRRDRGVEALPSPVTPDAVRLEVKVKVRPRRRRDWPILPRRALAVARKRVKGQGRRGSSPTTASASAASGAHDRQAA